MPDVSQSETLAEAKMVAAYQRQRSVLMHAIGFIEGVALGIRFVEPSDAEKIAENLRETAIELREQLEWPDA